MTFYETFVSMCNRKGVKPTRVMEELGMSRSTLSYWRTRNSVPSDAVLLRLADYFGCDVNLFQAAKINTLAHKSRGRNSLGSLGLGAASEKLPLLGTIACGAPILALENVEEMISIPPHVEADFALRCRGDSMAGAHIFDGDIVYVRQQPVVENGEIAAVLVGDEATLKRVYLEGDSLTLLPENPSVAPLSFSGEEMNDVIILGKAVAVLNILR